ncbi:MAG: hypothetical protein Kow00100_19290 [Geothermobacteraceae bacterium]
MIRTILMLLLVVCFALPAYAADKEEGAAVNETDCASDVRPAVKTVFESGQAAGKTLEQMVADAAKIGPNLCGVLIVAKELGYGEEAILLALQKAGYANNVIAAAAMDAGYDGQTIARVVGQEELAGLGYTPGPGGAAGAPVTTPATIGGGGRGATTVSPAAVQ